MKCGGTIFYGDARTLDTHIKLLRKSLGKYASYIVTLRGSATGLRRTDRAGCERQTLPGCDKRPGRCYLCLRNL